MGAMDTIGGRVGALLIARRQVDPSLSQTELARRIGIAQPSLSDIITDKTVSIAGKTLAGLCRELHVTPEFIMFGAGENYDDQELVLIESEILALLRSAKPETRDAILRSARGLAHTPAPSPANPYPNAKKTKAKSR